MSRHVARYRLADIVELFGDFVSSSSCIVTLSRVLVGASLIALLLGFLLVLVLVLVLLLVPLLVLVPVLVFFAPVLIVILRISPCPCSCSCPCPCSCSLLDRLLDRLLDQLRLHRSSLWIEIKRASGTRTTKKESSSSSIPRPSPGKNVQPSSVIPWPWHWTHTDNNHDNNVHDPCMLNRGGKRWGKQGATSTTARILAEQREPLIKILYATNDGQVKEIVRRRPPPNRFTMSEQDVDDVAFLTGETARRSNAKQRIAIFLPPPLLFLSLLLFIFPFSFPPFLFSLSFFTHADPFFSFPIVRPDGPLTTLRATNRLYEEHVRAINKGEASDLSWIKTRDRISYISRLDLSLSLSRLWILIKTRPVRIITSRVTCA